MIHNQLLRYLKLSIILSLLPICTGYAMQPGDADEGSEQIGQVQEQTGSKKTADEIEFDYNLLSYLPGEIFHMIMMLLSNDSSFDGLRYCYKALHKITTKELAEADMRDLWEKMVLSSETFDDLNQKISVKFSNLKSGFPNYEILANGFNFILSQQRALNHTIEHFFNTIESSNWLYAFDYFKNNCLNQNLGHESRVLVIKEAILVLKGIKNKLHPSGLKHQALEIKKTFSPIFKSYKNFRLTSIIFCCAFAVAYLLFGNEIFAICGAFTSICLYYTILSLPEFCRETKNITPKLIQINVLVKRLEREIKKKLLKSKKANAVKI